MVLTRAIASLTLIYADMIFQMVSTSPCTHAASTVAHQKMTKGLRARTEHIVRPTFNFNTWTMWVDRLTKLMVSLTKSPAFSALSDSKEIEASSPLNAVRNPAASRRGTFLPQASCNISRDEIVECYANPLSCTLLSHTLITLHHLVSFLLIRKEQNKVLTVR